MGIEFSNSRDIELFVDAEKNIVIFPKSKSNGSGKEMVKDGYYVAYYPIELKYPYTAYELAEKIKCGFYECDKHECYNDFSGKNTFFTTFFIQKCFQKHKKYQKCYSIKCWFLWKSATSFVFHYFFNAITFFSINCY